VHEDELLDQLAFCFKIFAVVVFENKPSNDDGEKEEMLK
jgi:hypothetical protein